VWLEIDRLGLTVKKSRTPTNSGDLMSRRPAVSGGRRSRFTMPASASSWISGVTTDLLRRYARSPREHPDRGSRPAAGDAHGGRSLRPTERRHGRVRWPDHNATFCAYVEQVLVRRCDRATSWCSTTCRPQTTRGPHGGEQAGALLRSSALQPRRPSSKRSPSSRSPTHVRTRLRLMAAALGLFLRDGRELRQALRLPRRHQYRKRSSH
jgi:hypothetical protein